MTPALRLTGTDAPRRRVIPEWLGPVSLFVLALSVVMSAGFVASALSDFRHAQTAQDAAACREELRQAREEIHAMRAANAERETALLIRLNQIIRESQSGHPDRLHQPE